MHRLHARFAPLPSGAGKHRGQWRVRSEFDRALRCLAGQADLQREARRLRFEAEAHDVVAEADSLELGPLAEFVGPVAPCPAVSGPLESQDKMKADE